MHKFLHMKHVIQRQFWIPRLAKCLSSRYRLIPQWSILPSLTRLILKVFPWKTWRKSDQYPGTPGIPGTIRPSGLVRTAGQSRGKHLRRERNRWKVDPEGPWISGEISGRVDWVDLPSLSHPPKKIIKNTSFWTRFYKASKVGMQKHRMNPDFLNILLVI